MRNKSFVSQYEDFQALKKVTRIIRKKLPITETLNIKMDLYYKRILYIYD